jgi:hypothetical protein
VKRRTESPQAELPGVLPEVVKIPSLTRAVKQLKTARAEYQKAGMDARDAGDRVRTLMHEHADKLVDNTYQIPGMTVTLVPGKETVKIKMGDEEPEEPVQGDQTVGV